LRVEPDLPLLRCDAVLLVQLMNNLVDNAIRYAGNSSALEIQARRVVNDVMLSVGDRGPGVPLAWRERIFDAFERGDYQAPSVPVGAERGRRGAGIGLAVCRAIANAHGGRLRVRSRTRGGSSFECLLPIEAQPLGSEAPGTAP
jgi:two-component system sensor histidine kinase KdpD